MTTMRTGDNPGFCTICGADFHFSSLRLHLELVHSLRGRSQLEPFGMAYRELSCALLGITEPEWAEA